MSVNQQKPESIGTDGETELPDAASPSIELDVQGGHELLDTVEELAMELDIEDYTAPGSGINHGHGPDKHDVRSAFGVRDEFVEEHFHSAPNDHAAVWELAYRKDEFIAADDPLFAGKPDSDASTWSSIQSRKSKAPIPDETHRTLKGL